VSSLQTGVRSGPVGSRDGQHRDHPDYTVREEQATKRLYTPQYGVIEIRMRALMDPAAMVALWMIGFEDAPERSAELCICEIFGSEVREDRALVGMGLHPFGDPSIVNDFEKVEVGVDVRDWHSYAAEWTPERVSFFVDGRRVKVVEQSPAYPMQLLLDIYEFSRDEPADPRSYPKEFLVDRVRGYRRISH
jgi:beta-glucanase (GH16 family)